MGLSPTLVLISVQGVSTFMKSPRDIIKFVQEQKKKQDEKVSTRGGEGWVGRVTTLRLHKPAFSWLAFTLLRLTESASAELTRLPACAFISCVELDHVCSRRCIA
eukprot:Tamp_08932.p8 GENE.Tamp_08932~~Tamp_08932.p8  ORF type:complete len:105 (+),score=12.25 Tamp_08932:1024-1338(+)